MTTKPRIRSLTTHLLTTLSLTALGCDDGASRIAQDAARRQAEQNLEMARVNQGVLRSTQQLHAERAELNRGRDALETERQDIARSRRTESTLAILARAGGASIVVIFALALAWVALTALVRDDDSTEVMCELFLRDWPSDAPRLAAFPHDDVDAGQALLGPPAGDHQSPSRETP